MCTAPLQDNSIHVKIGSAASFCCSALREIAEPPIFLPLLRPLYPLLFFLNSELKTGGKDTIDDITSTKIKFPIKMCWNSLVPVSEQARDI